MKKQVRFKSSDLPNKIEIEKVELVDKGKKQSVSKIEVSNNIVKLTTSKPHDFVNNDEIIISKIEAEPTTTTYKFQLLNKTSGILKLDSSGVVIPDGTTIQFFRGSPSKTKKRTTYYVVSTGTVNQYKIYDTKNLDDQIIVTASTNLADDGGKATKFTATKVFDFNSPLYGHSFTLISATSIEGQDKYVKYTVSGASDNNPHDIKLFDYVRITETIKLTGTGASNIFDTPKSKVVSVTSTTFTVKLSNNVVGTASGGKVRVTQSNPIDISLVKTPDKIYYNSQYVDAPEIVEKKAGGKISLFVNNINTQYFLRYTTKTPHNLVKNDYIDVYSVLPATLNLTNAKIVNDINVLPEVTIKTFCFQVTFDSSEKSSTKIYFFAPPTGVPTEDSATTYKSGGFLNVKRYFVRYRFVSDDANRSSKWSKLYNVENQYPQDVLSQYYDGGSIG